MKEKLKQRKQVWDKCKEIWRCVCSLKTNPFPCPCPYFLEYKICKCNWEDLKEWHDINKWVEFNTNKIEK